MLQLNTVHEGDCLELMKEIPDGSVDLVLCDPPYGTTACKWDTVIPFEPMWEQLKRVIKPNGAIVLFGSEPFSSMLRISNLKMYKYDWKWIKNHNSSPLLAKKQPLRYLEDIIVFYTNQSKYFPQGLSDCNIKNTYTTSENYSGNAGNYTQTNTGYPKNYQFFNVEPHAKCLHSTQKPVALLEYLIKTYTNEGETVLDFTAGSGSTGVAAKNLNRNFILIEKEPKYVEIAKKRLTF